MGQFPWRNSPQRVSYSSLLYPCTRRNSTPWLPRLLGEPLQKPSEVVRPRQEKALLLTEQRARGWAAPTRPHPRRSLLLLRGLPQSCPQNNARGSQPKRIGSLHRSRTSMGGRKSYLSFVLCLHPPQLWDRKKKIPGGYTAWDVFQDSNSPLPPLASVRQ